MLQSVLQKFPTANISVSIVWIQMPGFNDNETTARKIAGTLDDPRVAHFYDPLASHRAGKAFAEGLIHGGGVAWDIYFFYEKGATWGDKPPTPAEWMHQLGGGRRADPDRFHPGKELVDELHKAMHKVTGEECAGS